MGCPLCPKLSQILVPNIAGQVDRSMQYFEKKYIQSYHLRSQVEKSKYSEIMKKSEIMSPDHLMCLFYIA